MQTKSKNILGSFKNLHLCSCGSEGEKDLSQLPVPEEMFSKCSQQNPALEPVERFRKKKYRFLGHLADSVGSVCDA